MKEFIKLYAESGPDKAKAFYYNKKVHLNIETD